MKRKKPKKVEGFHSYHDLLIDNRVPWKLTFEPVDTTNIEKWIAKTQKELNKKKKRKKRSI